MQVTKQQLEPCEVLLDIQMDAEEVEKGFDRAYREFNQITTVPGFRPGKAPRTVLERFVNKDRLKERVREILAVKAYKQALQDEQINAYGEPEVEFSDLAEGQPWQFKASVPTPPQVELGDYSTIEVERPIFEVTDEDVDRAITNMREEQARLVPVEDRGVAEGDVLIAELAVTPEGAEPAEPQRTLIRMGNNLPGFDEAVMGQKPEEEREFDLTYPEDFEDKELAGKRAHFHVKVMSLNQRVLPDLGDEWVKQATPYQTVEELRSNIRERLTERYKEMSDNVTEARIVDELIKRSKVDFPAVMVEEEIERIAHDLGHRLEEQRATYQEYLDANNFTKEQHRAQMAETAEGRVKSTLVLRELARKENFQVSDEDLASEFGRLADRAGLTDEDMSEALADRQQRGRVANIVVKNLLRDFLLNHVTIKEVPVPRNA